MKLLIASQHELIGQSLAIMFEHQLADQQAEVKVCDISDALGEAREWEPHIIALEGIIDFQSALTIMRSVLSQLTDVPVLMLGMDGSEASICAAITAGADGYVAQNISPPALAATVLGMARGELGLSREATLGVVRRLRTMARTRQPATATEVSTDKLTQREREVFELVKQGKRSKEIADELCIAEGTVYKHIQNILDKFHAHSRTHAIFVSEAASSPN